ncbi:MAG: ATP/GTP-binding protein [Fuerstiella sp.]
MMKSPFLILLTFSTSTAVCIADEPAAELPVAWEISEGLQAPESAYYDQARDVLFLSQIGEGGGKAEDGDGWISKISTDGKVLKNKWVTGLNAPKGVRSHGKHLYVSDINRVVVIDIDAGKIERSLPVPDAVFLNDLATDSDGNVYVSDMVLSRIYRIKDGAVSVFAEGETLEHPNGVLVDGASLIIGGWGSGFNTEDFSTKVPGRLQKIDLKTKQTSPITTAPTGHLDGIEADGNGGYIVTDWRNGKLFHISADGSTKLLQTFPRGAADHAYLQKPGLIILPRMLENKLTAFRFRP